MFRNLWIVVMEALWQSFLDDNPQVAEELVDTL